MIDPADLVRGMAIDPSGALIGVNLGGAAAAFTQPSTSVPLIVEHCDDRPAGGTALPGAYNDSALSVLVGGETAIDTVDLGVFGFDVATEPTAIDLATPEPNEPIVSRGDRLEQFRRQIASLFEVTPDRVDIVIRT